MSDLTALQRKFEQSKRIAQGLARGLYAGGKEIESEAKRSITEGAVSGKGHVPSAPGEPPMEDTGVLRSHIDTHIVASGSNPEVHVRSRAPYAVFLETGTRKMAARPYMAPAARKKKDAVAKAVGAHVSVEIRRMFGND